MDFWMLRVPTGCRLSNPKLRKAAKIHAFGRIRIILVTLSHNFIYNQQNYAKNILKIDKICFIIKAVWG